MKDPFIVLLYTLGLIFFLFHASIVWFKPKQHLKDIHERRVKFKSCFPFLPDWFIGYIFFFEKPVLTIWWSRIISLIAVILCIILVIAAVHGPF